MGTGEVISGHISWCFEAPKNFDSLYVGVLLGNQNDQTDKSLTSLLPLQQKISSLSVGQCPYPPSLHQIDGTSCSVRPAPVLGSFVCPHFTNCGGSIQFDAPPPPNPSCLALQWLQNVCQPKPHSLLDLLTLIWPFMWVALFGHCCLTICWYFLQSDKYWIQNGMQIQIYESDDKTSRLV